MKKLILKNGYSPGDIVMLTAAVRDLHQCHPRRFLTDVRTPCPDLWENNPHLTPLDESDPDVTVMECVYPLINRANHAPYHSLHGFIDFLNERLKLAIRPTEFKGDIHLSEQERLWYSQVHEVTSQDTPFWIIAAGGKFDVTVKWWESRRYQEVVDHFRGRIQFVQIGQLGHHHPRLKGVIDLRGRTSLRELVRLVYHAQGVLCPVTAVMHLAAAVETRPERKGLRPCVVVAGGREPVQWEAYPGHQFLHTIGALPCCARGGCWKDRTEPLGDGDARDRPEHQCVDVVAGLPRCLDLIKTTAVIDQIERFYEGGALSYLTASQAKTARRGVRTTADNSFDEAPLNLATARSECEAFLKSASPYPGRFRKRGIVICGGGVKYFTCAWVCIQMLRRLGCSLPIELWHLGAGEFDGAMEALLAPFGVQCRDAEQIRRKHPTRRLGGWELKAYAILHSSFREVLLLDADNVPVRNPEFLFRTPQFQKTGAIFWPDYGRFNKADPIWHSCRLKRPDHREFESGQIVVDKSRCWTALRLAMWFNEHSDFYYRYLHGDKETFHLAFRKANKSFSLIPHPIHTLDGTMCQHDFHGRRLFQHRNLDKWNLFLRNRSVPGFEFESECREMVRQLQNLWDGRMGVFQPNGRRVRKHTARAGKAASVIACLISCPERQQVCRQTVKRLAATDWDGEPVIVQMDRSASDDHRSRQTRNALSALRRGLARGSDFILFLEDDLEFNRHLWHNLQQWTPLQNRVLTLAGLYNPGLPILACGVKERAIIVPAHGIFGSQAFLISRAVANYFVRHWDFVSGMQDIKMSRLAGRMRQPIYYHSPSLVQHVGRRSVWGGGFHQAADFDPSWRA